MSGPISCYGGLEQAFPLHTRHRVIASVAGPTERHTPAVGSSCWKCPWEDKEGSSGHTRTKEKPDAKNLEAQDYSEPEQGLFTALK